MKGRVRRGLALLLTLCLLSGNIAFAEELPAPSAETSISEAAPAQNEETMPRENEAEAPEENEAEAPDANEENTLAVDENTLDVSEEKMLTPLRGTGDTIYLNGQTGDDGKDGQSETTAVESFGRAKALAEADPRIKTIVVTGTVDVEGEISLAGDRKVLRGPNFHEYLFKVQSSKEAIFEHITIDGNSKNNKSTEKALIYVGSKATLRIGEGAVIRNNKIQTVGVPRLGGGIYAYGATIEMTGGTIEENEANYGGGIALVENSYMNFSGGVIQKNHAQKTFSSNQSLAVGGGVMLTGLSELHMYGDAIVIENASDEVGGGISVGHHSEDQGATFTMRGGTIKGNTAGSSGGGLFIQTSAHKGVFYKAFISKGAIIDNKMTGTGDRGMSFGGGGIYINGHKAGENGELHLKNAIIRDNHAEGTREVTVTLPSGEVKKGRFGGFGGGYAACPISKTTIRVNDGVAIYGNKRRDAGFDLYIQHDENPLLFGPHSGIPDYDLSQRMLGGALWNWIDERNNQPLEPEKYSGHLEDKEKLPLRADFSGSDWVDRLGTVLIAGNTSVTAGGGIGSNGTVFFGTEGETTQIKAKKEWKDLGKEDGRPKEIEVQLMARLKGERKEYVVETRTVKASDNWEVTFENLPTVYHTDFELQGGEFKPTDVGKEIIYRVKEIAIAGYDSKVTGDAEHGFIVTNKRKPETPPPTPSEKPIEIPVEKIWQDEGHEDKRPIEITVTLYADGARTDKTLVLSAANEWKGVFRNLPEKKDGKIITYTVKEVEVKGYESVRTGNQSDGFTLTNTYKPEKPPTPPTPPTPPKPSIPIVPHVRIPRAGA